MQQAFLRSRANSIEGGTSEVMRNILGERVRGLPGHLRPLVIESHTSLKLAIIVCMACGSRCSSARR